MDTSHVGLEWLGGGGTRIIRGRGPALPKDFHGELRKDGSHESERRLTISSRTNCVSGCHVVQVGQIFPCQTLSNQTDERDQFYAQHCSILMPPVLAWWDFTELENHVAADCTTWSAAWPLSMWVGDTTGKPIGYIIKHITPSWLTLTWILFQKGQIVKWEQWGFATILLLD